MFRKFFCDHLIFFPLKPSDLITTLSYVLLGNFCPCFKKSIKILLFIRIKNIKRMKLPWPNKIRHVFSLQYTSWFINILFTQHTFLGWLRSKQYKKLTTGWIEYQQRYERYLFQIFHNFQKPALGNRRN